MQSVVCVLLFLINSFSLNAQSVELKIGAIFDENSNDLPAAFEKAIEIQNSLTENVKLTSKIVHISSSDSQQIEDAACSLLNEGVLAIIGPSDPPAAGMVSAICKNFHIPHILSTWRNPTDYKQLQSDNFTLNIFPKSDAFAQALFQIILEFGWKNFAVLYENEDSLDRLSYILEEEVVFGKKIPIYSWPADTEFQSFMKYLSKTGINYFIVDCSIENWLEFLEIGRQFNMTEEYINYFLTGFDMDTIDYELKEVGANITTIRIVDADSVAFSNFASANDRKSGRMLTEVALIKDAVQLVMNPFVSDNSLASQLQPETLSCSKPNRHFADGEKVLSEIKSEENTRKIQHETITGPIHFDELGLREEFHLEVLELSKDYVFKKIAYWSGTEVILLRTFKSLEEEILKSWHGKPIRVVSRLISPFLMETHNGSTGNDRYMGFAKDLAAKIARELNTTYELRVLSTVGDNKKGPWNGVIGELVNRQADIAITDLTITHLRRSAIDFTSAFMVLGIDILLFKTRKAERGLFSFFEPLSVGVWMYLATAFLIISIVLRILARMSAEDWENPHPCDDEPEELENIWNMHNCIWLSVGSIMQQGCDILPKATSTRLGAAVLWFFALIIYQSYTANLTAFLTNTMQFTAINSVEALANQKNITYGLMRGGSTEAFFRDSDHPLYRRMWNVMDANDKVFMDKTEQGVEQVLNKKGKYAFFMESVTIDYFKEIHCKLTRTEKLLDSKGYGIGMPKGSKYRTLFSKTLLLLNEDNTLRLLKNQWWTMPNNESCKNKAEVRSSTPELDMKNVGGVFLVLGAGLLVAIVMGIFEFLWNVRKVSIDEMITPCEAFRKELIFACKVWVTKKPVKVMRESDSINDGESSYSGSRKETLPLNSVQQFGE